MSSVLSCTQGVGHGTLLYLRVADLDAVRARLADAPVVMEERTSFYGAREVSVRSPGGHVVTLAQFG